MRVWPELLRLNGGDAREPRVLREDVMKTHWLAVMLLGVIAACLTAQETAPAKTDDAATRQYAAAVALQNREVYDLAAEEWQTFVTKFPNDPRIDRGYHYLGICYLKNQQLDKAAETLSKVLKDYPQFTMLESTYLYYGVTQYNLGKAGKAEAFDKAAQTFDTLIKKYPQGKQVAHARFYYGEALYARGKKEEAAEKYTQLLQAAPQHELAPDATYALGVCQQELNRHEQAGQTFASFLKRFPMHKLATEVGMRQGETLLSMKRYPEAEKLFAAAASTPNFPHADFALLQQGSSLSARGQYKQAAAVYRTLMTSFPQSKYLATAQMESGKCAYLAGDYAGARAALTKIANAEGVVGLEATHWIARTYLKENQAGPALKLVEAALPAAANSPFRVQLEMDRADIVYEIPERRAEAVGMYAEIAAKHPQDAVAPQAAYMAAFASLGKGEYRQALSFAEKFLQAYSGNPLEPDVLYVMAETHLQLNEAMVAEELYRRLLEKYPSHADAAQWKLRSALSLLLQKKFSETVAAVTSVLPSLQAPPLIAESHYLAGTAQTELKQFDAAVASLKASLDADPKWRQADETLLALAHAYRQSNKVDAATAVLKKLVESFPKSQVLDRAHYRWAEYAYAAKDYPTAAAQYQIVVKTWPNGSLVPYAVYGLGWTQVSQGDYATAAKTLTELIDKYPQHEVTPRGHYARGLARQQLQEFPTAIEDLNAFLATNPPPADAADARYVLALCQVATDKRPEAVATFQSILKDFPQYAGTDKAMYELAWALKDLGKDAEAVDLFVRLSTEHENSPLAAESLFQAGEFAYEKRDYQKAADYYNVAIKKAGKSELGEKAVYKLGWSLFRQDRFEDAFASFAAQSDSYPQGTLTGDARFMQAECLFKQSKFSDAIPIYQRVKNPVGKEFTALALLHAGQAAGQLKDWEQSIRLLDRFSKEFPQSDYLGEALYEQGWANQNLGKLDTALALYRLVPDKTDREVAARAWFMSGEIYFDKKDHKEALRCFLKTAVSYNYPEWQANAHFEAGRCFEAIGKKDQAIQSYQEVTQKHPQSPKAPLAKERLDALSKT